MSGPTTPGTRPDAPAKQMSSRLLTMKFMQRAANSNTPPSKPNTPSSEPSTKRRKTDHTPDSSAPPTPSSDQKSFVSRSDVRAALRDQSAQDALAAARRAELGFGRQEYEDEWVLDVDLPVHDATDNAQVDNVPSDTDSDDDYATSGRQTYGGYKRKKKLASAPNTPGQVSNTADLDSESSEDADDDDGSELEYDERKTPSRSKKRKSAGIDLEDDAAMAALDRVDLTKSSYAKAKGASLGPPGRAYNFEAHRQARRGEKHPKKDNNKRRKNKKKR